MEYLSAFVLIVLAFPLIAIAAILVKLTSRGPAFYLQTRLGKGGRPFRLIKMRTMVQDAEKETGPVWATADDPRMTPVGRFLRDTHIDEFPQLINILLGHMALIGPRPERPEIAQSLEWQVRDFPQRLNVRPGITGLAQLKLAADSDLEGVHKKVRHDLYYIRYLGPWLDLRIMAATSWLLVKTMFRGAWRSFCLPSEERVYSRADRLGSQPAQARVGPLHQEED